MDNFVSPAQRKVHILRDAGLLLCALALLAVALDFPIFTAEQALDAAQRRHFFRSAQILEQYDDPEWMRTGGRCYILRRNGAYAWCSVYRYGPFWAPGDLYALDCPSDVPLAARSMGHFAGAPGAVLVAVNAPDVAEVELLSEINGVDHALRRSVPDPDRRWFLFTYSDPNFPDAALTGLRGYDAGGRLVAECELASYF